MAEKITFLKDNNEEVELYVIEQLKLAGSYYVLVTDVEEGDGDAFILKDISNPEDTEAIYTIVSDDDEIDAVVPMFETMLEDVEIYKEEE